MKKSTWLFAFIFIFIAFGCQSKKEKPEKVTYGRAQQQVQPNQPVTSEIAIDFTNKGIGPVKSHTLTPIDPTLVKKGKEVFKIKCTACHKMEKKFIGPALKGLLERRSPEWALNMMMNPEEMTQKDPIAKQLFVQYNGSPMANQDVSLEEATALLDYIRSFNP